MHIGMIISRKLKQEKLDASTVAEMLGKSSQAVYDDLKKEDLNTSTLRKYAEILHVPMSSFFEEEEKDNNVLNLREANNRIKELENEIIALKRGDIHASARVVVELNLTNDEFVKLGLKDKVIQVLNK